MDNNGLYIDDNIVCDLSQRISKENQIATKYVQLLLLNHELFISKLVGTVKLEECLSENKWFSKGTKIFSITCLNIIYEVVMEKNAAIKKIYVKNGDMIMFGTPLLMVAKK